MKSDKARKCGQYSLAIRITRQLKKGGLFMKPEIETIEIAYQILRFVYEKLPQK